VRTQKKVPSLVFIVDVMREATAVHEANIMKIPVIALVDTNCDPAGVDYIIPSNDDAIRAIKLLVAKVADAVIEGKMTRKEEESEKQFAAEAAMRPSAAPRPRLSEDTQMADKDLLGDSTLAKLGGKKDIEVIEEE
jgi:small subunit ribosomal protein S2